MGEVTLARRRRGHRITGMSMFTQRQVAYVSPAQKPASAGGSGYRYQNVTSFTFFGSLMIASPPGKSPLGSRILSPGACSHCLSV